MKAYVLDEPQLEFAAGNRHIDPRVGITDYGPADAGGASAPGAIPVALIGPAEGIEGMRAWLERCRDPIDAKESKFGQGMLFPSFPGFHHENGFCSELVFDDSLTRVIPDRTLSHLADLELAAGVEAAVELYLVEAQSLAETNRPGVIVCVRPDQLRDEPPESEEDDAPVGRTPESEGDDLGDFHDLLKARALRLACPLQIVRNSTWSGQKDRGSKKHKLQDEATRAWNIHGALYYKAGGSPWRMPRNANDLASCYVGVSFYRSLDGVELHTAMAQVFNERGDGVVVRGGPARISKTDRQPHLGNADATYLLSTALAEYRRNHQHFPARIVLHKSSSFNDDELTGFRDAASAAGIELLDLIWVQRRPTTRLFRVGVNPPLRGMVVELDDNNVLVYTRGTVEFYRAYPGMYVPRPLILALAASDTSRRGIAEEVLALSKMNWNNTQFDGREPVTLRTSSRVGDILKHASRADDIATRYAYYM